MHLARKDGTDRCIALLTNSTSEVKKIKSFHRHATQGRTAEIVHVSTTLVLLNSARLQRCATHAVENYHKKQNDTPHTTPDTTPPTTTYRGVQRTRCAAQFALPEIPRNTTILTSVVIYSA
jgi:hypothetical protein